jgi:hypothetical protein
MMTKAQMIKALQSLPEDATIDDAMERLYILAKIEIQRVAAGLIISSSFPHEAIL